MNKELIDAEFKKAVAFIAARDGIDLKMSDDKKLEIYALYKQSIEGDAPKEKKVRGTRRGHNLSQHVVQVWVLSRGDVDTLLNVLRSVRSATRPCH